MRLVSAVCGGIVLILLASPARNAPRADIKIGVLSLFHPDSIIVRFDTSTKVDLLDNTGDHRTIEGATFNIALLNGVMKVNGNQAARMSSSSTRQGVEIEIPGRIKRKYPGAVTIAPSQDGSELVIIITTTVTEFTAGAVLSEMGDRAPPEAQRALAVAAQSFLAASGRRHAKSDFDVCDTTHCMIYRGLEGGKSLDDTKQRLAETDGVVMTYRGKPIRAFFHSTCGGTTHTPEQVWGGSEEYPYRPVACRYCRNAPHYRWSAKLTKADVAKALAIPENPSLRLTITGKERLRIDGAQSTKTMTREEFRAMIGRAFGWNILYSPWFEMRPAAGAYYFTGRGFGHGIGLCEEGAMEMARRGQKWPEILMHYFPGASTPRRLP